MRSTATSVISPSTGVPGSLDRSNRLTSEDMTRRTVKSDAAATTITPMNPLQRLIRQRMSELGLTFSEVGRRGDLPMTTVHALATKTEHRQVPRPATLEKLAKGLDLPADVVRSAAVDAAGYQLEEITGTRDVHIVVATYEKLTEHDRRTIQRMMQSMLDDMNADSR